LHQGRLLFCDLPGALKKKFPGEILAVHAPEPARVRDLLAKADAVRSALLVGDRVHLFVDSAERRLPELRARLESTSTPYDSIQSVEPSIEDLFVSALEGESGNGKRN
jgi:ABC-2 type transport system ATP-binding protein